jgi:hypothetical protein
MYASHVALAYADGPQVAQSYACAVLIICAGFVVIFLCLVPGADQVVGESLDGLCSVTGLLGLSVVTDKDGLLRLGDAKT